MAHYTRKLKIKDLLTKKSLFLFGPRGTGKSTLIRDEIGDFAIIIDLLKSSLFTRLSANPSELEDLIKIGKKPPPPIVIDEIQKIPALLDEVHRLIEEKKIKFLLTGSSARKLKREGANMLGGRAWKAEMYPLSFSEIPDFDLSRALRYGTLPAVWTSEYPLEELDAYVSIYLKEEIQIESKIRNLNSFSRFLKVAALSSGQLINYAQVASDAQVPESTVRDHFQILFDTLLAFELEPFIETKKRKAIATSKFYLFDNGVKHQLLLTDSLDRNSDLYGSSFEAFIANEIKTYLSYARIKHQLCYWRSTSQHEVDFVIGNKIAIEVKSTQKTNDKLLKGLSALAEEGIFQKFFLVSQDPVERKTTLPSGEKVEVIPWKEFLSRLWVGKVI